MPRQSSVCRWKIDRGTLALDAARGPTRRDQTHPAHSACILLSTLLMLYFFTFATILLIISFVPLANSDLLRRQGVSAHLSTYFNRRVPLTLM